MNRQVVDAYYTHQSDLKTWHGHRLYAIDGSQIRLPDEPDIAQEFGVHPAKKNQKNCPLALASVYYDVLNHISIDSSINSTNASERECAASHLRQALPGDLSILDRDYNAFWLYALYTANQLPFCMRAKVYLNLFCKAFVETGEQDGIVHLEPGKTSVEQGKIRGLPSQALYAKKFKK